MQIYFAWVRYQRRAESMKDFFNFNVVYLPSPELRSTSRLAISYVARAYRMITMALRAAPEAIWVQAPPNFLVHLAFVARALTGGKTKIIADLHNAALSQRWWRTPLSRALLNRCDVVLVHNADVYARALKAGIVANKLFVLEDKTPRFNTIAAVPGAGRPMLVMPCSFNADEPVSMVIETARTLPQVDFIITGDKAKAQRRGFVEGAPDNVHFTGFLDTDAFNSLIMRSYGVLALTKEDGIQLSAASEALGAGKPMILSDTPLLRSLFSPAGLFAENNTAESLRICCLRAIVEHEEHANAAIALRGSPSRVTRWLKQAETVRAAIGL
ncbi:hypothetical protein GCM10007036_18500 [Alsobacter metallidurans]|uniref:Spore protein YkvP/CgeB glycosyl transferase-like domain-containing protein n=1 Tax=Alsobacter metallidurans TaxID=340221 RepID=A0A917MHE1_9HYPH|nr:glycosyltransferase [Alsobacter metallidurans]GGH17216.1 hypothetical protein GCM10007036_18500 [Alsobacter metallidurans]